MALPTSQECLTKSKEAFAYAKEHLAAASKLAESGYHAQAFGVLLYASEEVTKSSIYLYAHLGLLTFDPAQAGTKRWFNEEWLRSHPRKYAEFGRLKMSGAVSQAGFWVFIAAGDQETVAARMAYLLVVGFVVWAWTESFEDLRELAFHSGPPQSGGLPAVRPGRAEYEKLEPMVRVEVEHLEDAFGRPFDMKELESGLPDLATWKQIIALRPSDRPVTAAVMRMCANLVATGQIN